jgi:uncharacterized membrane protein YcaP (DUF421 family)
VSIEWSRAGSVALSAAGMYLALMVATRIAGRRTLAELSAFDVLTTIALGTILGSTAVSPSVGWLEGAVGAATLLALQVAIGAARQRSERLRGLLDFRPVPVVQDGSLQLRRGARGPQLTPDEVLSQLRLQGTFALRDVDEAILEPSGRISVRHREPTARTDRAPRTVLEDHLRRRQEGDLEGDLAANYDPDVVLLSAEGVRRGHEGVRALADVLHSYVPSGSYDYHDLHACDSFGLLTWSADRGGTVLHDGADAFVVRDGRIVAQTTHYTVSATS